jgi:hypothetical protein
LDTLRLWLLVKTRRGGKKVKKLNCWEIKKCGIDANGAFSTGVGSCPAFTETKYDGINGGNNGGRFCWAVEGKCCDVAFPNSFLTCSECSVLRRVRSEEGAGFTFLAGP